LSAGIDKVQLKVKGIASSSGLITLEADRDASTIFGRLPAASQEDSGKAMLLELVGLTVQGCIFWKVTADGKTEYRPAPTGWDP